MRCRDTICPNPGFRTQLEELGSADCLHLDRANGKMLLKDMGMLADKLVSSQAAVRAQLASEWLYTADGKPVDKDVVVLDDDDGNGLYMLCEADGVRRGVCRPTELL